MSKKLCLIILAVSLFCVFVTGLLVIFLNDQYGLALSNNHSSSSQTITPVDAVIQRRWDPDGVFHWPGSGDIVAWGANSEFEYAVFDVPTVGNFAPWSFASPSPTSSYVEYSSPLSDQLFKSTQAMLNARISSSYKVSTISHGYVCEFQELSGAHCKWEFWNAGGSTVVHIQRFK